LSILEEHHFIPYQVAELFPGPWLVFAPHADDETFGMGGSLIRAANAGIETHVIVLTDGALGGTDPNLAAIRQQELQQAAELLGLSTAECWLQPDRGLSVNQELIAKAVETVRRCSPKSVFFPAPFEPHPDHRMTMRIVWAALQSLQNQLTQAENLAANNSENLLPTPFSYEIGCQSPVNTALDITDVIERKREVMAFYASQNSENDYPNLVEALDRGRTFSLPEHVCAAEAFFRYQISDISKEISDLTQEFVEKYSQ